MFAKAPHNIGITSGFAIALALFFFAAPVLSGISDSHIVTPLQPIPPSFFGMDIQYTVIPHGTTPLTPWPGIRVPGLRLWDAQVTWPDIEPHKGEWRFDTLDRSVEIARKHDTEIMLPLAFTPVWASARPQEPIGYSPGWAAEPANLEDWRIFVRTVATRYKGRIHVYEIWNEPNVSKVYWTGLTDQMIALTREAHDVIKSVDPTAILVSPSATTESGTSWLSDFMSKGGGRYVDVIGYHFYVTPQPPEAMVPLIQKVRNVIKQNGAGDKPLWNTESGWAQPKPFPSEDLAAAFLARAYILNWALGVRRFYWYSWDNHDWVSLQTTESDDTTLTSAGRAYGIIQNWLVGARMLACSENTDHIWVCQLRRNGSPEWIVWNPNETKSFEVPPSWHIKNVTPLLQERSGFIGPSLNVGPIPQLLMGYE